MTNLHAAAKACLDATDPADKLRMTHSALAAMQSGELRSPAWQGMPSDLFFRLRLAVDIGTAYYSHPHAWSEIGFGGPANPRGYVRMQANRRDPWEPAEAHPGQEDKARRENGRVR